MLEASSANGHFLTAQKTVPLSSSHSHLLALLFSPAERLLVPGSPPSVPTHTLSQRYVRANSSKLKIPAFFTLPPYASCYFLLHPYSCQVRRMNSITTIETKSRKRSATVVCNRLSYMAILNYSFVNRQATGYILRLADALIQNDLNLSTINNSSGPAIPRALKG